MIILPVFNKNSTDSISTSGKWRLVFSKTAQIFNITYANRKTVSVPLAGDFTYWTDSNKDEFFVFLSFDQADATRQIKTQQAEIPIYLIYAGVGILALGAGAFFLIRVEKVIDNPAIEIGLIVGALVVLFILVKKVKNEFK